MILLNSLLAPTNILMSFAVKENFARKLQKSAKEFNNASNSLFALGLLGNYSTGNGTYIGKGDGFYCYYHIIPRI